MVVPNGAVNNPYTKRFVGPGAVLPTPPPIAAALVRIKVDELLTKFTVPWPKAPRAARPKDSRRTDFFILKHFFCANKVRNQPHPNGLYRVWEINSIGRTR